MPPPYTHHIYIYTITKIPYNTQFLFVDHYPSPNPLLETKQKNKKTTQFFYIHTYICAYTSYVMFSIRKLKKNNNNDIVVLKQLCNEKRKETRNISIGYICNKKI